MQGASAEPLMPAFARNADDGKARGEGAWRVLKHEPRNAASAAGAVACGRTPLRRIERAAAQPLLSARLIPRRPRRGRHGLLRGSLAPGR